MQPSAFASPVPGNNSGNSTTTPASFGHNTGATASVFGSNATTTPTGLGTNPFGSPSNQTTSTSAPGAAFQTPAAAEESRTYTPMDRLTAEELAEFQATHFTLGKIPTKPPPKELCF
jgi:nucleoporin-like protein 2